MTFFYNNSFAAFGGEVKEVLCEDTSRSGKGLRFLYPLKYPSREAMRSLCFWFVGRFQLVSFQRGSTFFPDSTCLPESEVLSSFS